MAVIVTSPFATAKFVELKDATPTVEVVARSVSNVSVFALSSYVIVVAVPPVTNAATMSCIASSSSSTLPLVTKKSVLLKLAIPLLVSEASSPAIVI